jgi:hypothetical protein
MGTFIWNANPAKWNFVPPAMNSWDALKAYITDPSGYVYWSTPVLHGRIKIGDSAFIWRTKYRDYENGNVAVGRVEEVPRQLSPSTHRLFSLPQRLLAAGWNEAQAPSSWKTGIRITRQFWDAPLQPNISTYQGTVRQLGDDETQAVEAEINSRKD